MNFCVLVNNCTAGKLENSYPSFALLKRKKKKNYIAGKDKGEVYTQICLDPELYYFHHFISPLKI